MLVRLVAWLVIWFVGLFILPFVMQQYGAARDDMAAMAFFWTIAIVVLAALVEDN